MPYAFFYNYFPDIAPNETRSITVQERLPSGLPVGEYGFIEMYCNERGCDCRRVFWYVMTPGRKDPLAVIAYGWEKPEFYARWMRDDDPKIIEELKGPSLNLASPQSHLAPALLELAKEALLTDQAYINRIKEHYRMFQEKIEGKRPLISKRTKLKIRKAK